MERQQAQQEDTLIEVSMDRLEVHHRPRGSPASCCGCSKCAGTVAAVMGLVIVALLAGFILYFFTFLPSCNQDVSAVKAKVNITHKIKKTDGQERYDLFTVDKAASYLIYGWVKFTRVTGEEVVLMQTLNGRNGTIQKKIIDQTEIFFSGKVKLANGITLSMYFSSSCTDGSFHLYEL